MLFHPSANALADIPVGGNSVYEDDQHASGSRSSIAVERTPTAYLPTRFFAMQRLEDGSLILYNARTGAVGAVPADRAESVRTALRRSSRIRGPLEGILSDLAQGGFLVPEGVDELALVRAASAARYDRRFLNLIVLPTEQCNFRCVYCYEEFRRSAMIPETRSAIRRFVAAQHDLERFDLHWFGGEPLLAPDVVIELTQQFFADCTARDIKFSCGITTNGSLLTEDIARQLIPFGLHNLQITLDGLRDDHDHTRLGADGGPTFDVIMANLRMLKHLEYPFVVSLRHNFSPGNLERLAPFIAMLREEFGGDPRFTTLFEAVGRWGGANDATLEVCDEPGVVAARIQAMRLAVEAGFRNAFLLEYLRPGGFMCYAASPRSFVIGADGSVYKCTVELDYHERNVVGRLRPDGEMDLDWKKFALWTETNGEAVGAKCGSCFFLPSCGGAVCPKECIDRSAITCPPEKVAIREVLAIIARQAPLAPPPPIGAGVDYSRG